MPTRGLLFFLRRFFDSLLHGNNLFFAALDGQLHGPDPVDLKAPGGSGVSGFENHATVPHCPAMGVGTEINRCKGHRNRNFTLNPGFPLVIRVDDMPAFSDGHNTITNPGRIGEKILRGQIR